MKKLFILFTILFSVCSVKMNAQEKSLGYFNSISIGANIGTTGWGFDIATPIGNHLALRAGFSIMPNIKITDNVKVEVDIDPNKYDIVIPSSVEVEGSMGRTSGEVLLNVYPFKRSSFFITGGAFFGGDKLLKIKGHSDELKELQKLGEEFGIQIGDYYIPVDKNGDVSGGVKVASFRPYLGLGFGRIVPKKRVGFMFELGVQFHKTPKVYSDFGDINDLLNEADDKFTDFINNLNLYPVIRFRLCGRIF